MSAIWKDKIFCIDINNIQEQYYNSIITLELVNDKKLQGTFRQDRNHTFIVNIMSYEIPKIIGHILIKNKYSFKVFVFIIIFDKTKVEHSFSWFIPKNFVDKLNNYLLYDEYLQIDNAFKKVNRLTKIKKILC